jgi:hypothetical protein
MDQQLYCTRKHRRPWLDLGTNLSSELWCKLMMWCVHFDMSNCNFGWYEVWTDTISFVYVVYLVSLVCVSSIRCQFWDKYHAHHFVFHQLCIQAVHLVNIDRWFRYNPFVWDVMWSFWCPVIFGGMKYDLIWIDWNCVTPRVSNWYDYVNHVFKRS